MAEGVGFEPTDPCGSPVFKTGAIDQLCHPSKPLLDLIRGLLAYFAVFLFDNFLPTFKQYANSR